MAEAKPKDVGQNQDQSMEEILQSIRRIIAEEGDTTPGSNGEEMNTSSAKGSDVLELTDVVNDDGSVVNLKSQKNESNDMAFMPPVDKPAGSDVLTSIDTVLSNRKSETVDGLLSNEALNASANALRSLTGVSRDSDRTAAAPVTSPVFRSGNTVEDLVMESLRPMLKSWLDSNLPNIVERVVEREVRKISSRFEP